MAESKQSNEEAKVAKEHEGKNPYYFPDSDVTIWAVDSESATKILKEQLKSDKESDKGGDK